MTNSIWSRSTYWWHSRTRSASPAAASTCAPSSSSRRQASQLAAAYHALQATGRRPVIALRATAVPSYRLRAGFVGVVRSVAAFDPAIKREFLHAFDDLWGANPMLVEVTKIEPGPAFDQLLDRTVDILHERLGYLMNDAYDVAVAVSELLRDRRDAPMGSHRRCPQARHPPN